MEKYWDYSNLGREAVQTETQPGRQAGREAGRQAGRQKGRQPGSQADRISFYKWFSKNV